MKIDGAFITALTLYASQIHQNQDVQGMNRLGEIGTILAWRYLEARHYEKQTVGDALKVLGLNPEEIVNEPEWLGQKCYLEDSPMSRLKKTLDRASGLNKTLWTPGF